MPVTSNADGLRIHYGRRLTNDEANFGQQREAGSDKYLIAEFRGSDFTASTGVYNGPTIVLKAGFIVREVSVEVLEVFVLGGTTPTIAVGTSGSEVTNFLTKLTQAQAQAVATLVIAPGGTLAVDTVVAADTTITAAMGGTTPTITAAGRLKVAVRYTDQTPV